MKISLNRALAYAAGILALGALLVGDRPNARPNAQQIDVLELATWIRDHKPGLRVIDLRTPAEYDAYHIPGAEQLTAARVLGAAAAATIVAYSDTGSDDDGAVASTLLPPGSTDQLIVLRGGVNAWLNDIMLPRLPPDPTAEQRQRYERQRELSHYFGGRPSALGVDRTRATTANAVGRLRRMGC